MKIKQEKTFNRIHFAKRLRQIRIQLGITQNEMGLGIKRTRGAYVQIERGKSAPSLDLMINLLKFLRDKEINVSVDYLLGLKDFKHEEIELKGLKEKLDSTLREFEHVKKIVSLQEQILAANNKL